MNALASGARCAANGWANPYRFDGRDRVRYDTADGLYWLATRAYDPTLGRFLARDPLGRAPLFFADNPYVYAGNNPLSNVDPTGQYRAAGAGATTRESGAATNAMMGKVVARVVVHHGTPGKGSGGSAGCGGCKVKEEAALAGAGGPTPQMIQNARNLAHGAAAQFSSLASWSSDAAGLTSAATLVTGIIAVACDASSVEDGPIGVGCGYLWSRATLAAAALDILAIAVMQTASQIGQAFENLHDPLLTPDAWFLNKDNLNTLYAEMLAGLIVASTAATALISLLSFTGGDGLALLPTAVIGGLGMFYSESAWVDSWMEKIRTALGYA